MLALTSQRWEDVSAETGQWKKLDKERPPLHLSEALTHTCGLYKEQAPGRAAWISVVESIPTYLPASQQPGPTSAKAQATFQKLSSYCKSHLPSAWPSPGQLDGRRPERLKLDAASGSIFWVLLWLSCAHSRCRAQHFL